MSDQPPKPERYIRLLYQDGRRVEDGRHDLTLDDFAGQVPAAGDLIVDPGVQDGLERHDPRNRRIWTVVRRVFNPNDQAHAIGLIVEVRAGTLDDQAFA